MNTKNGIDPSSITPKNIGRNDVCWCGSGKKYKKCHMGEDARRSTATSTKSPISKVSQPRIIPRSPKYIEGMRATCHLAKEALDMVESRITAGISTNEIDNWVSEFLKDHHATAAPLNYHGFPKSICTSINEVICHGIPGYQVIKDGDIINVDITCILDGYFGDTSRTFLIGNCSEDAKKLTQVTKECLDIGIQATSPFGFIGDIGAAIQKHAHAAGFSVVEQYVGHGIGKKFHMDPQVPHFGTKGTGPQILPGMCFTIEPMINLGRKDLKILKDNWTAVTIDNKLSAQFEHTLLITETGVEVLTA